MSSAVYYKFRSQKSPSRALFDGTGISVFDLKRSIIAANALDATADQFELKLTNPDTSEEYTDDSEVIPRSTSVEARRMPIARHNTRDSATRYVSGQMVVNARNAGRREDSRKLDMASTSTSAVLQPANSGNNVAGVSAGVGGTAGGDEESQMAAMFQSQGELWQRTQEEMAGKAPVYNPRAVAAAPERPPPSGYVCHRCGQKGHWIAQCPTLSDPTWEAKRVRRTTGIPRSMLRTVAKPDDVEGGAYMVNADGEYVVAVADDRSWQDYQRKQKELSEKTKQEIPQELTCPLTHKLIETPVKTPCCDLTCSESAITDLLIGSDFVCPKCGKQNIYLDLLKPDKEMEAKVKQFVEGDPVAAPATGTANNFFPFMMPFMMPNQSQPQNQNQDQPQSQNQGQYQDDDDYNDSYSSGSGSDLDSEHEIVSGTKRPTLRTTSSENESDTAEKPKRRTRGGRRKRRRRN